VETRGLLKLRAITEDEPRSVPPGAGPDAFPDDDED
jgi:hypothetical protein